MELKVKATRMGYRENRRIYPGENFKVSEKDFSPVWMLCFEGEDDKEVEVRHPETNEPCSPRQRDEALAEKKKKAEAEAKKTAK